MAVPPSAVAHVAQAATAAGATATSVGKPIPPIIRSCLTLAGQAAGILSVSCRGAPGMEGGLLYKGVPYCYAVGYRDHTRGSDPEDRGNHLRLRDPLGCHYLSIPALGQLVWILHQEQKMPVEAPLTSFFAPGELPEKFERLTARELLSYSVGISDDAVYKHLGLRRPLPTTPRVGQRYFTQLWQPLRERFGEGTTAKTPSDARAAVLAMLREAKGDAIPTPRVVPPSGSPRVSNFGFCVLAAAIERVTKKPFEDIMFEKVFQPLEAASAGYGVPAIIARTSMFFEPQGRSHGHYNYSHAVAPGDARNCAPSIFNASLNMFAQPEDLAKIMITSIACSVKWMKDFAPTTKTMRFYEMGVCADPKAGAVRLMMRPNFRDVLPYSAAFWYNNEKDVGGFAVANCGSGRARLSVNSAALLLPYIFQKQVLDEGVDPFDEDGSRETVEKLKKQADANLFARLFRKDTHSKL